MSAALASIGPPASTSPTELHTVVHDGQVVGWIAIDSTVAGRARGGLRMVADVAPAEITAAARSMTLKYGFLGLPQGGAKAGVCGDGDAPPDERARALDRFAAGAADLLRSRRYVPDADMGTTAPEIRRMVASIGMRVHARDWPSGRSGEHTARSCFACAEAVSAAIGLPLRGARVAIEGFGKVGTALARLLAKAGARVVAVSTSRGSVYVPAGLDVDLLTRRAAAGSAFVERQVGFADRAALFDVPVDWLFPCARFHGIDAEAAGRLRARVVCAGANDPVSPAGAARLAERGTLLVPDFVSNAGGVLGGTLEFAGVPFARAEALVGEVVGDRMRELLRRAGADGPALRSLAEADALARHAEVRARADAPDLGGRVMSLAIEAYRRGWIPASIVGRLAPHYLRRQVA